jgi:hypothetical protein
MGVRRLAAAPLPQPHQSGAVSRAKATAILNQPQFRPARPNLWTQFERALGDRLARGFGTLFGGGFGAVLGWLFLAVLVGGVVALAVFATRSLRRDPERAEPPLRVEVRRSAIDWSRQAEAFEERGEWKEGLRCRYRALVAELIATHVVLDLPGRTTGEYRGDVAVTLPEAGPPFGGASELFERAWYGDRPTGADQSRQFAELAAAVVEQAHQRRAAARAGADDAIDDERRLVAR